MNILDEIVAKTKSKLEEKKQGLSLEELSSKIDFENLKEANFKKSLQNKAESIIAEIKKASPSAGIISDNFDPVLKSKEYESFGEILYSLILLSFNSEIVVSEQIEISSRPSSP